MIDEQFLYNIWIHSFEEDDKEKTVYRPKSFVFPLSRGREGFQLKSNGEFIYYSISSIDGHERIFGRFKIIDQNKLDIEFPDRNTSYVMTILSCEKDRLVVQKSK